MLYSLSIDKVWILYSKGMPMLKKQKHYKAAETAKMTKNRQ